MESHKHQDGKFGELFGNFRTAGRHGMSTDTYFRDRDYGYWRDFPEDYGWSGYRKVSPEDYGWSWQEILSMYVGRSAPIDLQ